MNNLDFEKTQIWAKNLAANPVPPVASIPKPSLNFQKPAFSIKKPVLRPLTKEEKITLAAGGALAIGLGAIVITSLSEEDVDAPSVIPSVANLNAPKLDLDSPEPVVKPAAPEPAHHTPPTPRPPSRPHEPAREHSKPDGLHALIDIPETPEVATTPKDEQTFIDAFNAARKEVGPAGLFAWRDTYYSTFTDKEWESVAEDKKALWLDGAQPIIDPHVENVVQVAEPVAEQQNVIVAERGAVTWTGIDKDEDGQAEILMARINGQSPMVLMDTDGDGLLDTRYDYEASSGRTYASVIDPISMSAAEIAQLEIVPVGPDMGFFNQSTSGHSSESLPVSIVEYGDSYVVSLDSNNDNTVDAITYLTDDRGPIVGLDHDNDGQIETGYVYDSESGTINFQETAPMEEMTVGPPEYQLFSEASGQEELHTPDLPDDEALSMNEDDEVTDDFDSYFKNSPDESDEYQNT
ncbi:hypothetical protein [Dyadobacter fanqingshengii]|uniref:Uncharacterized protein n=1 Tax=Dyadobacter fanqingshengii TaxID=2906443 RepID=A0A9X1PAU8_9BACT|nr:hypothetical protein [Dyadobacter fanqingshengii]MCF0040050.1 hypothetical protein [Dyadobacter fanqingshengii]USJ38198.1 hypothetical protein NFI81_10510 [Dyadobacter fanqingshengii]